MQTVEIYTFSTCPYCVKAKALLESENIAYKEYEISADKETEIAKLKERTACKTVPQIFVDGQFIGGCDDLYQLYDEGKFPELFR